MVREVVIDYTSKHLQEREQKWTVSEKEVYAIVHAVTVFRTYLYGQSFTLYTDQRPLEWLMSKMEFADRLTRWAIMLQEYDIVITYRPGKHNQNADCLSRLPVNSVGYVFKDQTLATDRENESNYNTVNLASEKGKTKTGAQEILVRRTKSEVEIEALPDHQNKIFEDGTM